MILKEEYLKAKQIVQEYEKQLNISDVIGHLLSEDEINKQSIDWATERWNDDEILYKESKFDFKSGMLIAKRVLLNAL